jgi:hypothetical protein
VAERFARQVDIDAAREQSAQNKQGSKFVPAVEGV